MDAAEMVEDANIYNIVVNSGNDDDDDDDDDGVLLLGRTMFTTSKGCNFRLLLFVVVMIGNAVADYNILFT